MKIQKRGTETTVSDVIKRTTGYTDLNEFINGSLPEYKIKELDKESYFYILEKNMIGDSEEHFYSEEYGFNFKPTITNIL